MWNVPSKERLARIPRLYETEDIDLKNKKIYLHFFIFGSDWFIAEYNGDDLFFGYAILNNDFVNAEWGYMSFEDLREINVNGIEIDCENDFSWKIKKAVEIEKIRIGQGWNQTRLKELQ